MKDYTPHIPRKARNADNSKLTLIEQNFIKEYKKQRNYMIKAAKEDATKIKKFLYRE